MVKQLSSCLVLLSCAAIMLGCDKTPSKKADTSAKTVSDEHNHDGWWCNEHGVPEEVCALCDTRLVDDFKAKGDWCKEHDRPESQCFVCNPEKEAEFAAQYEAKYGSKPPKPTDTGTEKHDHDHDHDDHGHDHKHDSKS